MPMVLPSSQSTIESNRSRVPELFGHINKQTNSKVCGGDGGPLVS